LYAPESKINDKLLHFSFFIHFVPVYSGKNSYAFVSTSAVNFWSMAMPIKKDDER
jgi:hypothetical protein